MTILNMRTTEVLDGNGVWNQIDFKDIKKGDVFRLFEDDGEIVTDCKGHSVFEASSDAYVDPVVNVHVVDIMKKV